MFKIELALKNEIDGHTLCKYSQCAKQLNFDLENNH